MVQELGYNDGTPEETADGLALGVELGLVEGDPLGTTESRPGYIGRFNRWRLCSCHRWLSSWLRYPIGEVDGTNVGSRDRLKAGWSVRRND